VGEGGIPFTGEVTVQGREQMRIDIAVTVDGKEYKFLQVVNRDKGWRKNPGNNKTEVLKKDRLEEQREQMYAGWVASLAPLRDKEFKFAPVGEIQINGQAAIGVRVDREGHRPVNLFFDKKTGLLAKSEFTVKDEMAGDREVTQEILYSEYKTFDGTKHATRLTTNRDGKRYSEGELVELKLHESLDDSSFGEP
jgi:hypothetical protein